MRDRWHQSIRVTVHLPSGTRLRNLRSFLLSDGYKQSEDIFSSLRTDTVEVWQPESLVDVSVFNEEKELYFNPPYADTVTKVVLCYLLPWLPLELAESFISSAVRLSEHFDSPMQYLGRAVNASELREEINLLAKDLTQRVDAPGSEFLAIAIAEDLPL